MPRFLKFYFNFYVGSGHQTGVTTFPSSHIPHLIFCLFAVALQSAPVSFSSISSHVHLLLCSSLRRTRWVLNAPVQLSCHPLTLNNTFVCNKHGSLCKRLKNEHLVNTAKCILNANSQLLTNWMPHLFKCLALLARATSTEILCPSWPTADPGFTCCPGIITIAVPQRLRAGYSPSVFGKLLHCSSSHFFP